jgi:hypothetical protein
VEKVEKRWGRHRGRGGGEGRKGEEEREGRERGEGEWTGRSSSYRHILSMGDTDMPPQKAETIQRNPYKASTVLLCDQLRLKLYYL